MLLLSRKICTGFGITLSQFFQEEEPVYLTNEQNEGFLISGLNSLLFKEQRSPQMLRSFLYIKRRGINFFPLVSRFVSKANFREHPLTAHPFQNGATGLQNSLSTRLTHGLYFCSFYIDKINYSAAKRRGC